MPQLVKSFTIDILLLDNLITKYGDPIFSKKDNIYCYWYWQDSGCRINVYKNKKDVNTLKVVVQGNDVREYIRFLGNISLRDEASSQNSIIPAYQAGGDEAGKGEDFGPLVIAVVMLTASQQTLFRQHSIRDSKDLTDASIAKLAEFILSNIDKKQYCILTISPAWINSKRETGLNLHDFMIQGYNGAIKEIAQNFADIKCDLIIDGFVKQESFDSQRNFNYAPNLNVKLETKAENKYLPVACASIIARYQYVKIIQEYDKNMQYTFPIGANFETNIKPFISFLIKNKVPKNKAIMIIKDHIKNNLAKTLEEYESEYSFYQDNNAEKEFI